MYEEEEELRVYDDGRPGGGGYEGGRDHREYGQTRGREGYYSARGRGRGGYRHERGRGHRSYHSSHGRHLAPRGSSPPTRVPVEWESEDGQSDSIGKVVELTPDTDPGFQEKCNLDVHDCHLKYPEGSTSVKIAFIPVVKDNKNPVRLHNFLLMRQWKKMQPRQTSAEGDETISVQVKLVSTGGECLRYEGDRFSRSTGSNWKDFAHNPLVAINIASQGAGPSLFLYGTKDLSDKAEESYKSQTVLISRFGDDADQPEVPAACIAWLLRSRPQEWVGQDLRVDAVRARAGV